MDEIIKNQIINRTANTLLTKNDIRNEHKIEVLKVLEKKHSLSSLLNDLKLATSYDVEVNQILCKASEIYEKTKNTMLVINVLSKLDKN